MRQAYRDGGAQAALDLYGGAAGQRAGAERHDRHRRGHRQDGHAGRTPRTPRRPASRSSADGSKFTLSAESMWKTLGDRKAPARVRTRRLAPSACSPMLLRPCSLARGGQMVTLDGEDPHRPQAGRAGQEEGDPQVPRDGLRALRAAEGQHQAAGVDARRRRG